MINTPTLIAILLFVVAIYLINSIPTVIEQECECGEHEKCVSKITITSSGGIRRDDLLKCGKVRQQMKRVNEILKKEKKCS